MDPIKAMAYLVLAVLALSDLRRRRLPNVWVSAFAALYLLEAALNGSALPEIAAHAALGAFSLGLAAVFFRLGWLGGGDVKFGAAVLLWCGPAYALALLVIVSVSGALLGLSMLALAFALRHPACSGVARRTTCLSASRGVPYGLPLALGGAIAVLLQPTAGIRAVATLLTSSFGHPLGLALIGHARFA
ncbi:prepilin peptidase [Paraburkholderia sp. NMBU_R16]|uniref:A24 family peptidase n=1 Tax=Paraburkholderia sp. NMBU_R16 TaxID=2698676 RepID=UPI0020B680B8|nr:prepilin peptidase [Paraburkholderia sp. NMBU_R16]